MFWCWRCQDHMVQVHSHWSTQEISPVHQYGLLDCTVSDGIGKSVQYVHFHLIFYSHHSLTIQTPTQTQYGYAWKVPWDRRSDWIGSATRSICSRTHRKLHVWRSSEWCWWSVLCLRIWWTLYSTLARWCSRDTRWINSKLATRHMSRELRWKELHFKSPMLWMRWFQTRVSLSSMSRRRCVPIESVMKLKQIFSHICPSKCVKPRIGCCHLRIGAGSHGRRVYTRSSGDFESSMNWAGFGLSNWKRQWNRV